MKAAFDRLRKAWRNAARLRIMTWALVASVLCGATGFLEPLDEFARNLRFLARNVPADQSIVVVGMDDRSVAKLGGRWPWSRHYDAQLIESLKRAGANKIVFDRAFADLDTPKSDAEFIATLKRHSDSVFLGVGYLNVRSGKGVGTLKAAAPYAGHAGVASFASLRNPIGQISKVATMVTMPDGHTYRSLSSVLANVNAPDNEWIRPDFSIRRGSFTYISFADALNSEAIKRSVAGKNIVVGLASKSLGDTVLFPGQGETPGVYTHAIAAQTLKRGPQVDIGWVPPLILAVIGGLVLMTSRNKVSRVVTPSVVFTILAFGPIVCDSANVILAVSPAVLLFAIVTIQNARLQLGWRKSRLNEVSGLANTVALREILSVEGTALIAAKVDNYSAIIASFPRDVERTIVDEIASRLRMGSEHVEVFQSNDGVFYWLMPFARIADIGEHLEGLRAVIGSALQIVDRRVDISIAFGVDADADRSMASRVGSALLCADEALRSGSRWKLYDAARSSDAAWELSIASEIDRALDDGQFWLAFQPKLNLLTGTISGAEVLARWRHPLRGDVSPGEFIPAAERTGRIHRLTDYVIDRALEAAGVVARYGPYKLAVNVSSPILSVPEFAPRMAERVAARGLDPSALVLEITESVLMSTDDAQIETTLARLRADGFGLSIDDFGTGFSSLDYVRRIPAHEMKIDQSFVRKLVTSEADQVIVESIIDMAHHLGRKVVAEGVEDAATLDRLRAMGCDEVQGYHIGKPMPLSDFAARLRTDRDQIAA